jgi:hypothetical protein
MKENKSFLNNTNLNNQNSIAMDTVLNPQFTMADRPITPTEMYTGDSINEHKAIEEANYDFAEGEIGQSNQNS